MEVFGRPARSVTLSHAKHQKIAYQNRQNEFEREKMLRRLQQDKTLQANMASDGRVEERRFLRNMQRTKLESETDEAITKAQLQKELRERQREQENKLAQELEALKLEEMRTEKLKQQYRENSLDLRELEAKLRAGYMNKERAAQLAEKRVLELDIARSEAETVRQMQEMHERAKKMEIVQEQERWQKSVEYQEQLECQLQEQEKKKEAQYEEFLKEKLMIDEIVRRIYEEDQRDIEARLEKQRATREYVEEFMKKRDEWKFHQLQLMEEENERIKQYATEQQEREEQRRNEKIMKEAEMSAVQTELSNKIAAEQYERDEMERVRTELHLEEQEEANRMKEMMEAEKRIKDRIELQDTMNEQLRFKELKILAERSEEEEFRRQMLEKFYADDRMEQMNAQKRRMKQQEHKRAVEKLIEDRRAQLQREKERDLEEHREMERKEAHRRQVIEEERQRLLKEHATKLLGFLPKGVIRNSTDLNLLDERFKEVYATKKTDFFYEDF